MGVNDRYFNLKLFSATSNGFLCCVFFILKKMSLSHMSIHFSHNLVCNLISDSL